ncbi:MAG: competence/damage-inducible protein A [Longimicrobiales bacterium]
MKPRSVGSSPSSPAPGVEILAIGDELLLGETLDTNAKWIAARLGREGIAVTRKTTVGDDDAAIRDALAAALRRTHVVLCTGGLGPTRDDLTRDAVARVYGREQHIDEGWLAVLDERYARRGIPNPAINHVQALLPAGATLLYNATGTAPGIAIADEALGLTVLMPGVPSEMRGLMEAHVVPLLRDHLRVTGCIESRLLRTAGISEAALAERIDDIAQDLAPLTLAFLPQAASVDLRLTCRAGVTAAHSLFERAVHRLKERLGDDIYADDHTDLAIVAGGMLRAGGLTLALAESCTGGLVSKRLSDEPGASEFLLAGFVTYHNDAKRDLIGVRAETLAMHGAVSEQCAREMAIGARTVTGADVAVAVTGIAGPGGGSDEKPVGTVWYAVSLKEEVARSLGRADPVITRRFVHPGDRTDIRERAAQTALDTLRRALTPVKATPQMNAAAKAPTHPIPPRAAKETQPPKKNAPPQLPQSPQSRRQPDPHPHPAVPPEDHPATPPAHPW